MGSGSFRWTLSVCGLMVTGPLLGPSAAADDPARSAPIRLPAVREWIPQLADFKVSAQTAELVVPINYKTGRAVSPPLPVSGGELLTFAADLQTSFAGSQQSFYRCWLQMEFLHEERLIETVASPELLGTHASPQLLAVTAAAPQEATAVRLVACAQNKFWSVLKNKAQLSNLRLLRLGGRDNRGSVRLEQAAGLPQQSGSRTARLLVRADWPDGTAIALSTSRGALAPAVLVSAGRAEVLLRYAESDVGAATLTARVLDREVTTRVPDPLAGTLEIGSIQADGSDTPARVELIRDGAMIPGRYQLSMPGIFVTAPWSIDLAPGRWKLRVCRGPEFRAHEETLDVKSGQTVTRDRLAVSRYVDLRSAGWYGGDADGDVYHGEQIYTDVTAATAAEIARAMGLDWLGVGSWRKPAPKTWGEARAVMRELSRPDFLFLWTDEKPKSREGHVCLVGIERPDSDPFGWSWTGAQRPLRNFEMLQVIRASGAATFVNHPLRWWTSGDRFATNMYASLPFDLCAAGLLDGYNVNEKPQDIQVWSMLLDHGFRVAATAGTDFCLDRPSGPPPGKWRMYCHCPDGLTAPALARAVRRGHTTISNGPLLLAGVNGQPPGSTLNAGQTWPVHVQAWARGDEPDSLQRIELWSHGKAIATRAFDGDTPVAEETFQWQPQGDWDWVAVRAVSRRGWALTSAFYAAGPDWESPQSACCRLTLNVSGLTPQRRAKAIIEVWDNVPALVTSRRIAEQPLTEDAVLDVPVSATIVVRTADGMRKEISVYDAIGMPEQIERIASGEERERPLLDWQTYADVLRRCRTARATVSF